MTAPEHALAVARPHEPVAGHQLQSVLEEVGYEFVEESTAVHDAHDVWAAHRLAGDLGGAGHDCGAVIR